RVYRLRPAHVARDAHLDVLGAFGSGARVGGARRCTREGLQHIMIRAIELAPYADVDASVQVNRAPLMGARPRITARATRSGIRREPLPIDVAGVAGDHLLDAAPPPD